MAVVENLDQLEAPQYFSLVVAWNRGRTVDGGEVRVASKIGEHLRQACGTMITRISELDRRAYSADMHLEDEECLEVEEPAMIAGSPLAQLLLGPAQRTL